LADAGNIPKSRVDEALEIVGLNDVAKKGPGKFSLGMSQRLGIAAAILGKPKYLLLDEPANGLDPEGIAWLRQFIRDYVKEGNGVLISSHLLSEMSQLADNVVVIGKGKLIASAPIKDLLAKNTASSVFVRADNLSKLEKALKKANLNTAHQNDGLTVAGASVDGVGKIAHESGITILELSMHTASLEEAFLELTEGTEEFQSKKKGGAK
jgi:ABC-2 type transport system ATP-binding protein